MKLNCLFILIISFSAHLLFSSERNIDPEAARRAAILKTLRDAFYPQETAPPTAGYRPRSDSLPSTINSDTPPATSCCDEKTLRKEQLSSDNASFFSDPTSSKSTPKDGSLKTFQTNTFVAGMLSNVAFRLPPSRPLCEQTPKEVAHLFVIEGLKQ